MSDKLLNGISTQIEFDQNGGFKLTEVLDYEVLEAVGGGGSVTVDLPNIQIYCPVKNECPTNNCPPPTPPKPPAPAPTPTPPKPPEKQPDQDGDEG